MHPTVPAGAEVVEAIRLAYAAGLPVALEGGHGVGKSALVEQAAQQLAINYLPLDLSVLEPTDLTGLPVIQGGKTTYAAPEFWPTEGCGLISLEELNRAPREMRAPCLQLLLSKTVNGYRLPPGWMPMTTLNPSGSSYDVDELDPALLSRLVRIHVVASREQFLAWGHSNEDVDASRAKPVDSSGGGPTRPLHPRVLAFIESDPHIFDDPDSTPRTWEFASRLLAASNRIGASEATRTVALGGVLGVKRAAAFLRFLQGSGQPLAWSDVLNRYETQRAQVVAWRSEGKLDLLRASLTNVLVHLQVARNLTAAHGKAATWRRLGQFLADVPAELREMARADFASRNYAFPPARATVSP